MKLEYFLYVGNAYPHKNLNRLIEAIVLVNKKSRQTIKLEVVSGRNAFIERINSAIKKYEATEYVDLLGFVPDKKLKDLYKNSLAFVFPTLSEGFGLPGLEAMKSGTLVLASDIPVLREVYDSYAIYFDPLNPQSIATAMEKVIDLDSTSRLERIKNAKEFAKRYSWLKMAEQTLKIYEKVGKGGNSLRSG